MEATFGLWADATLQWGPRQVGWALAGLGVGSVLLQGGGAGRAAHVLGERTMLVVGLGLLVAGFGGMAVAHSEALLIVSLIVLVAGIGFATPALNSLIASRRRRSTAVAARPTGSAIAFAADIACLALRGPFAYHRKSINSSSAMFFMRLNCCK